jgi:hypothetical protein
VRLEKHTTMNKVGRTLQVFYKDDNLQRIDGPVCLHNNTWWGVKASKITERAILLEPLPHVHDYDTPEPEDPAEEPAILDLGTIRDALPTPVDNTMFLSFDEEDNADKESVHTDPETDKEDDPTNQQIHNSPIGGGINLFPYDIRTSQSADPLTAPPRYLGYATIPTTNQASHDDFHPNTNEYHHHDKPTCSPCPRNLSECH